MRPLASVVAELAAAVADQPGVLGESAGDLPSLTSSEALQAAAPGPGSALLTEGETAGLHPDPAVKDEASITSVLTEPSLPPALPAGHASACQPNLLPGDHLQGAHPRVTEAGGAGAHHPGAWPQLDSLAVVLGRNDQGWGSTAGSPH